MDDDNQDQPNRFPETYRSSSDVISSTTTPPSQLAQTGLITRRSRPTMNRFQNLNIPAADEDELQPSSSTPSFATPRQRSRNIISHLNSASSTLASPDSTYAGPSSMSNSYQHRSRSESTSNQSVQDPCVVSSSTADDIPPSPFVDDSSSHYQVVQPALRTSSPPPPSPSLQPSQLIRNSHVSVTRAAANETNTSESARDDSSAREGSQPRLSNVTQGSSYSLSPSNIAFSATSFSNNISPLRNKIKKASSFERFSAQAQASSNNSILPGGNNQNNSSNLQESNSSIISLNNVPASTVPSLRSTSSSSSWDYGGTTGSNSTKSNFVSSLYDPSSGILSGTKPFKKLVARLANEAELERLEAEAASALAADSDQGNSRSTNNNSVGCDTVDGVGHASVPPPQQGPCNTSVELVSSVDSLIRRQLSQSTLNIPECSNSGPSTSFCDPDQAGIVIASRNPMISAKTFHHKKIPLTPKQKLLHRMQSGEITIPLSTTPPPQPPQPQHQQVEAIASPPPPPQQQQPQLSPASEQQQNQILLNSFQPQQQHIMMHDLQRQLCSMEESQVNSGGVMEDDSASPNNDRYSSVMNYEAFIRSTTGEEFSDSMSKGDEGNEGNNQILYDTSDPYNYYYGNILTEDEIFINNNGGNGLGSVPLCVPSHSSTSRIVHSNMVHNCMEDSSIQFQVANSTAHNSGHLEFILGLPEAGERNGREDPLQLEGSEEMQIQQQQFLDSSDLNFIGGKGTQVAEISTLRNLLMMEPLGRTQHEESWISVAAAATEYQNRINSTNLRISGPMTSVIPIPGSNSAGSSGGSNAWASEWSSRVWQGQGQPHDEGEQDEVMDMSVMEIEKNHPNVHSITKRNFQHHLQTHPSAGGSQHGLSIEEVDLAERDLANGLPLLTSMPLPMDLQSTFVTNVSGKGQMLSDPSTLIMTPHHHHQRSVILEYEEEPVNLMSAVNLEQALVHHSQTTRESDNLNISLTHSQHGHPVSGDSTNSTYGNLSVESNIIFTTSTTSTTVAAAFETNPSNSSDSQSQLPQQQHMLELAGVQETNMDEKRIIRVKKKKENLEVADTSPSIDKKPNFILDKPVQPKSFASLPSILTLTRMSGNGWGVVTSRNKKIPINARFGPVEGPLKRASVADLENNDSVYPVLVMVDSNGIVYQLDRMDDDLCNWMKFVRRARSGQEQNVLVSEEDGLLYFTSCREIPAKTELQVGYGQEYAEKYNLPHFPVEAKEPSKEQSPIGRKSGSSKKSKRKAKQEIEKFDCFECEFSCTSMEELNKHLDTAHLDGDIDGFRRPKKKAIRKFYKSLNETNSNQNAESSVDVKLKGAAEVEPTSSSSTSKKSLKKKEIERLSKEQEEIPVVESSSPDIPPEKYFPVDQESSSSTTLQPKVKCNLCYKAFATQHRLQKHMMVHSDDQLKPLKCEICGKRFLTNSALAGHAKSHDGRYFECPLCEFFTEQLLVLREHVQTHKNEETGSFSCPHCPKAFSCYSLIRKHIRAFHGPRLYSCHDCSMKFPTPDKLKLHELRHSSFRAYLCAECGRQFKRKDKLTDHTRKAHGKLKGQARIVTVEEQAPITHYLLHGKSIPFGKKVFNKKVLPRLTEEQLTSFTFRCQDCMIGFRRRGMLVNHLAKRHPEIDPEDVPELALPITRTAKNYFCPHCERVYKSSSKRKSHILKNHPGKSIPPQVRGKDLKAILEEKVGSTTHDFNLNDFGAAEMENIKVSVDEAIRKEAVVGEIVGTPHACQWCHRQYATRAKLLQHQRKFHIELMPPEIQTPRPQKNNVRHLDQPETVGIVEASVLAVDEQLKEEEMEAQQQEPSPSEMEPPEKQILIPQQSPQENMFGYLITTSGNVTNSEIETLLQPEFVMNLLAQQNSVASAAASSSPNSSGARTITLCIPPGMISNSQTLSTNPPTQVISTGINVNGTQILTKTD